MILSRAFGIVLVMVFVYLIGVVVFLVLVMTSVGAVMVVRLVCRFIVVIVL